MGIDSQSCKTIEDAKNMADAFVRGTDRPVDRLKFVLFALGLPLESEPYIAETWERVGLNPLTEYAPFTAHALTVEWIGTRRYRKRSNRREF